jgi:uncharacterized protein with LGFP repeats
MLSNRVISANIETTCQREINNKMQVSKELCTQIGLGKYLEKNTKLSQVTDKLYHKYLAIITTKFLIF